jgi:hypothetical protein
VFAAGSYDQVVPSGPLAAQPPVAMIFPSTTPTVRPLRAAGRSAIADQVCATGS